MRKIQLVEALYIFNQGTNQAVNALERLQNAPSVGLTGEIYGETRAKLEHVRAQVNLQFFQDMTKGEQRDTAHNERP